MVRVAGQPLQEELYETQKDQRLILARPTGICAQPFTGLLSGRIRSCHGG